MLKSWMELKDRLNPATVNAVSLGILLFIGWLDYITGYEFGFFIFYFIPVSISAWLCGRRSGVIMAFASAACWFLSDKLTRHPYSNAYFIYWEMFMRYLSFLTVALTISKIRTMLLNEEHLNGELQKALQDKIELRELDRLKSAFLANVSHELKTPMSSIVGYTDLLLDKVDGPLNEEQEKSLKKVALHSKHLLQLINSLLDISKMESGELKLEVRELDLKSLIEAVTVTFDSLIKQKGLTLNIYIDKDLPFIYGDEDKIKQILTNLLSNAIKFTHKGSINISANLSVINIKPGDIPIFAEVCVEDTGIGIKEQDLGKIFDKFVQVDPTLSRQYEGTGIGLSITKGYVELHKGEIWITSKYGKGSKFCFSLPLKKELLENPDAKN